MSIYENVKAAVTVRDAAERYGLSVSRNGITRCLFHDDHNPSMKVDERYYCFGCQATGDVIDFTARMFGLSNYEAAQKLAADFGISGERRSVVTRLHRPQVRSYRHDESLCLSIGKS